MSEDVKKVTNLEDAEVDGINPSLDAGATKLDPENINQDLEDLGLPELPPEVIEEVETAYEAVQTLDDLWKNLIYQHRDCLLYTSPSPRDLSTSRMPSSA